MSRKSYLAKGQGRLKQLLSYGSPFSGSSDGSLCLVVPRPGTISPWSSKATDIVHNSGLTAVKRVERGIAYYLAGAAADNQAVAKLLHDRMTETVLADIEAARVLFETHEPPELRALIF